MPSSNTAYITHLFGSTDPALSCVLHGNTCAHDMNIISSASVLSRTPADVIDMLSVVFIGPGNLQAKHLNNLFHIHKKEIWSFLLWLQQYNLLYADIILDPNIFSLYSEDDCLPGICNHVLVDSSLKAKSVFMEESAGFSEHPAELIFEF